MLDAVRCLLLAFVCVLAACPGCAGGSYVQSSRSAGDADHGETNGRRFDFVSNMPDKNDDWQIRITGSSMWVSYAIEETTDKLGTFTLTDKETAKVWKLIDALDIPSRKHGKRDEDAGYVSLQLKEGGEAGENSDIAAIYMSRGSEDEDLINLAKYLQDLTQKYKKRRPKF